MNMWQKKVYEYVLSVLVRTVRVHCSALAACRLPQARLLGILGAWCMEHAFSCVCVGAHLN